MIFHGRCAHDIGRLEERIEALQRELSDVRCHVASCERHAEQIARLDERVKALERQLTELESRLAQDQAAKRRNVAKWLQVLASGMFVLAGAAITVLLLAYVV